MRMTLDRALPGIFVEVCTGIIGFILSLGWWKVTGRTVDRKVVLVLASIFGVIMIGGTILIFIL